MNMRKMLNRFRNTRLDAPGAAPPNPASEGGQALHRVEGSPDPASNVIPLPQRVEGLELGLEQPGSHDLSPRPASPPRFKGLTEAPELKAFFDDNHFGLGRHNGSHYRTQEAMELGRRSLISKFQNTVADLIERNQAKVDRLESQLIAIEGVSAPMSAQLRLACEQLRRDISVLRAQVDSAGEGKGWVLEALNRYQIGFAKGLREVIDFELLVG